MGSKISTELLKGSNEMMILQLLATGDMYGYEMLKKLNILSKGVFDMKQGSLYPILHFLEDEEYIVSYWEETQSLRKRKYFHITNKGLKFLECKKTEWNLFVTSVNWVLEGE